MSKTTEISVLTANRLADGVVVFLDYEGAWSENLAEAVVARSPDEARQLEARGTHDAAHNIVVEPYLVEVRDGGGSPRAHPLSRARARGRPEHPRRRARLRGARLCPSPQPSPRKRGEGGPSPGRLTCTATMSSTRSSCASA